MERYNFKEIDSKWQKIWSDKKIYNSRIIDARINNQIILND